MVLTRCAEGLDFSSPFFTHSTAVPVIIVQSGADEVRGALARAGTRAHVVSGASKLTPSQAVDFCFRSLGATRVSVEAGPSVAAELYKAGTIDATALTVLTADDASVWNSIPVVESDPLFDDANGAASILHTDYVLTPEDPIASLVPSLKEWQVARDSDDQGDADGGVTSRGGAAWSWTWWTRKAKSDYP